MVTPSAFTRSIERLRSIGQTTRDHRELRLTLLEEVRKVVPFDAYAWLLTDPETSVGSAPLADVPCLPELPELIRLKYLTALNRWTTLAHPPAASLLAATEGDPTRSRLWRELLRHHEIVDVASMVFRDRFGCWAFLDLWRSAPAAGFDERELAYLVELTGAVTPALRRSQAAAFVSPGTDRPDPRGPIVLLLAPDLHILGQTVDADDYLRRLVPPEGLDTPIPSGAYNVAAQLLAVEAGIDTNPPTARVHLSDGLWLTLRAARMGPDPMTDASIAVTIEPTPPTERVALFASAFALSPRERELLEHLVTGADTRTLARELFVSEHTVQDHLKSIFAKTSTPTRRALVALALGA